MHDGERFFLDPTFTQPLLLNAGEKIIDVTAKRFNAVVVLIENARGTRFPIDGFRRSS